MTDDLSTAIQAAISTTNRATIDRLLNALDRAANAIDRQPLPPTAAQTLFRLFTMLLTPNNAALAMTVWRKSAALGDPRLSEALYLNRHLVERLFCHLIESGENWEPGAADLGRILEGWKPAASERSAVMVTAMQKSGSTYFSHLLGQYLDQPVVAPHSTNRLREEMDQSVLRIASRMGAVIQCHLPAGDELTTFLHLHRIRPVVILRDIFECIASYAEHVRNSHYLRTLGHRFDDLPVEDRLDFTIDFIALHYVNFVASWQHYAQRHPVLVRHYDDNRRDWTRTLGETASWLGRGRDDDRAAAVVRRLDELADVEPGSTRRSREKYISPERITPAQKERVRRLYRHYPKTDFSLVDGS